MLLATEIGRSCYWGLVVAWSSIFYKANTNMKALGKKWWSGVHTLVIISTEMLALVNRYRVIGFV